MVDLNMNLGRNVVDAADVLSVIEAHLRSALLIGSALEAGFTRTPDGISQNGDAEPIENLMLNTLVEDAVESVQTWAHDVQRVFDRDRLRMFVRMAMVEAWVCATSDPVAEVLERHGDRDAYIRVIHALDPFAVRSLRMKWETWVALDGQVPADVIDVRMRWEIPPVASEANLPSRREILDDAAGNA